MTRNRYVLLACAFAALYGRPAYAQVTANLPVTCNAAGTICTQATPVVNPDGTTISGGGGGGDASAANQVITNTTLGAVTASPTQYTVGDRLKTINTTLGSPFQSGGSIGNTVFGATQSGTWNLTNITGTISLPTGAASATLQTTGNSSLSTIAAAVAAATPAGENYVGHVGGTSMVATATPTVSASPAYSIGDVIGTKMTFAGLARLTGGSGMITMAAINSKSAQTAAIDLCLFHTDPSSSTFTDNAAMALAAADFDKLIDCVHITDWTSLGTPSFAKANNTGVTYKIASGQTDGFGVLVARGALTLGSTSDFKVVVKAVQD